MKEQVAIFGAGAYAKKVITIVEKYYCVEAICDNCHDLWGSLFENRYTIISADELIKKCNLLVLIALDNYETYMDVSHQLSLIGVIHKHVNDAIYHACTDRHETFYIEGKMTSEIEKINSNTRNIFVLTAPSHSNLGDQAQSYCIEMILKRNYPDSNIFIYSELSIVKNFYELLYIIRQWIKAEDRIFLHSGYRLSNLHKMSEYIVEMMITVFEKRKLVFLPQTLNYTDDLTESRISKMMNENITVMCRDIISCEKAEQLFKKSKIALYPDVVTTLIGKYDFNHERNGILLVLRKFNDGESLLSESEADDLFESLNSLENTDVTDTTISENWEVVEKNRKYYIEKEISKYAKHKLVITNRYHGAIFSLIANTPVIILPTKDHKVTAGLTWFNKAKYEQFYLCANKSQICNMAKKILECDKNYKNPPFFYENFYKDINFEAYF